MAFVLLLLVAAAMLSGQNKPAFEVERLRISAAGFSDISPVIHSGGLLFCSDRKHSIVRDNRTWDDGRSYNIYYSEMGQDGNFRSPRIFSRDLASIISDGPFCFSPDGNTIYFTRNIESGKAIKRKNKKNPNGIFMADRMAGGWTNIRAFEYNNESYNTGHPTISSDGSYLFFSSDMPGGFGKSDIYYCEWKDGGWSAPVNAGPEINSVHAEIYPGFHPSGRLYFSSDRPPTRPGPFGGLNIYYSYMHDDEWTTPVMLGEPVNSYADDFAFTAYNDGQSGYFSSSRRRDDDLYAFRSVIVSRADCAELEENNYCYVYWEDNAVLYDTIPYEYEWDFGDGNTAKGIKVLHCFDGPGTYVVSFSSRHLVTGEIIKREVVFEEVVEMIEQAYITVADTVRAGEQIELNALETHLPGWNIGEYTWNFGDETAGEGERVMKSYLMPGIFDIQLIVSTIAGRDEVSRESCVKKRIVVVGRP